MLISLNNDRIIPENVPSEYAFYEAIASQEEIYLEQIEESLRAILISEDPSTYVQRETACVDCCIVAETLDEELGNAAEELFTGDSDDPPLSQAAVGEMLRVSHFYRLRPAFPSSATRAKVYPISR